MRYKTYNIYDGEKLIFHGSNADAKEAFEITGTMSEYALHGMKIFGRFRVMAAEDADVLYEAIGKDGKVAFIGSENEFKEHFNVRSGDNLSQYIIRKSKFRGYTIRRIHQISDSPNTIADIQKMVRKIRNEEDKDTKNYVWMKKQIQEYGNTGCPNKKIDWLMGMLQRDGIECYITPFATDKKWSVVWKM